MTRIERLRRFALTPYIYMAGGVTTLWLGSDLIGKIRLSDRWWIRRVLPQRLQSVLAVFSVGASVSLFIVRQNDFDNNRVRAYIEARYPAFRYRRDVRIHPAPGWTLHRICVWIFSPRTVVEILEPSLSDMQVEFLAALKEGRTAKARWVQIRGYWNFWTTLVMQIPASATRALLSYWRGV